MYVRVTTGGVINLNVPTQITNLGTLCLRDLCIGLSHRLDFFPLLSFFLIGFEKKKCQKSMVIMKQDLQKNYSRFELGLCQGF